MMASVLGLGLFLAGPPAPGQEAGPTSPAPSSSAPATLGTPVSLRFVKEAGETWAPSAAETPKPAATAHTPATSYTSWTTSGSDVKPAAHAPVEARPVMLPESTRARESGFHWPWSKAETKPVVTYPAASAPSGQAPTAQRPASVPSVQKPSASVQRVSYPVAPSETAPALKSTAATTPTPHPTVLATPASSPADKKPAAAADPAATDIERTAVQQPRMPPMPAEGAGPPAEPSEYQMVIPLEPPGPQRLFRLESEADFQERMRQEARERPTPERVTFPEEPVLTKAKYPGRSWPRQRELAEPNYVCYHKLLFEEKNSERYGWDFGIVSPVVSTAWFYWDVVTLPYHKATAICRKFECSADYCLPGSPVPYMLYPPELSATGLIAEAAVVVGVAATIFP